MDPVRLLTYFSRALAHELRTPLSVISNELTYLSSKVPEDELAAAKRKCRELAELLSESIVEFGEPEEIDLEASIRSVLKAAPCDFEMEIEGNFEWNRFSRANTELLLSSLFELMRPPHSVRAIMRDDSLEFVSGDHSTGEGERFGCFCELYIERLGTTKLAPIRLDALLLSAGFAVEVVYSDGDLARVSIRNGEQHSTC